MDELKNLTYDDLHVGASMEITHTVTASNVAMLSQLSGDAEIFHPETDKTDEKLSVQGVCAVALMSNVVTRRLPGPGSRIVGQELHADGFITDGDELTASVRVRHKHASDCSVQLDIRVVNQHGDDLLWGSLTVLPPGTKGSFADTRKAAFYMPRNDAFEKMYVACEGIPPVLTAVVHPCDRDSLLGPIEAARKGLIIPVLIGPAAKIHAVAQAENIDLSGYQLIDCEHSHAAADHAAGLARHGKVQALMKGSLHTDELMGAVVKASNGLRTSRRVTHVFVMDVPAYPRMLLVTDAAINIFPTVEEKVDIVQNAVELAHILGIAQPKVAVLSAVETVNPKIQSTIDAAMLCKMADRKQITGCVIDGPLAFDNAVSEAAAKTKKIVSPVAGRADVLIVPDLEAGNMVAKQLQYLAGADSAGIVLGAKVPIVLTSRADSVETRMASTAVMALIAHYRQTGETPMKQND
ncbi:bifunctional enoyl-CoA hydratase/phosphate acetyltransferase [Niveibacterium sp.]|uniref:bifunctional enoyl-CoA hydratase/phosphate acetyltransferase n=1 Tax=Niveibacterium sp. TaxID=2017444 RepID=UPI0035AF3631